MKEPPPTPGFFLLSLRKANLDRLLLPGKAEKLNVLGN
jgi:hypothetical protein